PAAPAGVRRRRRECKSEIRPLHRRAAGRAPFRSRRRRGAWNRALRFAETDGGAGDGGESADAAHPRHAGMARQERRHARPGISVRWRRTGVAMSDLGQLSMQELFRLEAESQTQVLTAGLLTLERKPDAAQHYEACMRAAHSLKGAARIVGLDAAVAVAHA